MTDEELRQLIRGAIARHLGTAPGASSVPGAPSAPVGPSPSSGAPRPLAFARYTLTRVADDGMCLIEPAVRCNHCGYCESHGH